MWYVVRCLSACDAAFVPAAGNAVHVGDDDR